MTVEANRWHREPDPRQAEHDAVDEQRRQAEREAQANMTDAIDGSNQTSLGAFSASNREGIET
jgi:hypothetical protein